MTELVCTRAPPATKVRSSASGDVDVQYWHDSPFFRLVTVWTDDDSSSGLRSLTVEMEFLETYSVGSSIEPHRDKVARKAIFAESIAPLWTEQRIWDFDRDSRFFSHYIEFGLYTAG